jgi:hypothetical protein
MAEIILIIVIGIIVFFCGAMWCIRSVVIDRPCIVIVDGKRYESKTHPYIYCDRKIVYFVTEDGDVKLPFNKIEILIERKNEN